MVEESNAASHSLAIGVDGFDRLGATINIGALTNWHTSCGTA